jgi:hypothetical protein
MNVDRAFSSVEGPTNFAGMTSSEILADQPFEVKGVPARWLGAGMLADLVPGGLRQLGRWLFVRKS